MKLHTKQSFKLGVVLGVDQEDQFNLEMGQAEAELCSSSSDAHFPLLAEPEDCLDVDYISSSVL